jgi:hypothetical protein
MRHVAASQCKTLSIKSQLRHLLCWLSLSYLLYGATWCRRRDSNSHSFRHYPLKIACLPIPPRRHSPHILLRLGLLFNLQTSLRQLILLGNRLFWNLVRLIGGARWRSGFRCRCRCSLSRSRCAGSQLGRGRSRCGRGRGSRQVFHYAAARIGALAAKICQRQGRDEKNCGGNGREFRQKIGRARSAEQATRGARAEGRSHICAFAVLQKDEANNRQRRHDLDHNDNGK